MNQPVTEAELNQARRNQEFTDAPMGRGQCALRHAQVAIFPVRYALDESPLGKDSNQGPNPLPAGWSSRLPELQTRSYTLRQLRDGWLYVWNSVDQTFHEYQVSAEHFTRHTWTESQLNQDVRHNPGESHPYLLYPRRSQLRIAYSPVQWTWRLCELMRSSATEQRQWMRTLDLPAFCASGKAEHGGSITELGNSVADILVYGATAPSFTSTLLPTSASEPGLPYKPAFEEALVRGRVPEQDTALFIALDDPLAIVDDLSMNLSGRLLEQSQFENLHQHTLESAVAVERLCGFDTDAFIPDSIKDPFQRQAYIDDLYRLLKTMDKVERGKDLVTADQEYLVMMGAGPEIDAAQAQFKARWGQLPAQGDWQAALEEWKAKRLWREDVRFDEAQQYLSQTTAQAQRLQDHCQRSETDLLTWLERLGPGAEAVYHDACNVDQSSQLLETAHALYTLLGNGSKGQQWLCKEAERPSSLFGLALFNFNPQVATLIKTVSHNFTTYGTLDDQGLEGDGSSPALTPTSAGDATSLATRANELKAVFDLESLQNSKHYQAMSSAAKQALSTLVNVANHQARDAWHGLNGMLMPAMKQQIGFTLAATQVLISTEISSATQLLVNPTYARDYQVWLLQVKTVANKISGTQRVLQRPNTLYDQRAARIALQTLEEQMKTLFLQRPNQIIAKATGTTRLDASLGQVNSWLADLGQAEVTAQLKVAGTHEYLKRTRAWMGQNLGNALPALLVGLNAWNVWNTARQAQNDGRFTADEWRTLGANSAYAANAIAALWVGPVWSRAGGMATELSNRTLKVAEAGYSKWLGQAKTASAGSAKAAVAKEFAKTSKSLILRTVTWAALGAVAAGLEAWQISEDVGGATSEEEKALLWAKFGVVFGMSFAATTQLVGAGLGYWFGFAWVMSTPVTIILALLGIAYLMVTMAANRFKREGLRLWLYRCTWGRGTTPEWLGDEGHREQMNTLMETLQRPTVVGRALYHGGGSTPRKWLGFWLQIQVPTALAGKELVLQPAIVQRRYFLEDELSVAGNSFYDQFLYGNWVDPRLLGELPSAPGSKTSLTDFTHTDEEPYRLWQVWVDSRTDSPTLELEIKYPAGVRQRSDRRGYMFRMPLEWATNEADRINNALGSELMEKDGVVLLNKNTKLLKLAVPGSTKR
ncbi:T6SS effector BTH_I2691 family protein [Pseudomonas alkylphenolica]|uniref:Membrane protein n=1 Tax=Pseudomonas alkylphenolica TaxID=237609 RepID=A0A077FDK8_9PSED|nr:T6SS effector BTH_I2691 family protein [Pseudomonas alkylphenolica]AIL63363.1 membrane protein [Pseudomonas alkylphenolica]